MNIVLLRINNKVIRTKIVIDFVKKNNFRGIVCFSCGNASKLLKENYQNVIAIIPTGDFTANRWFTPSEIRKIFPDYFDATSGHLPWEVMNLIAQYYKDNLILPDNRYFIPTGSGETIICLKLAFPDKEFIPVYNLDTATQFDEECILNSLVNIVSTDVIYADRIKDLTITNLEILI